MSSKSKYLLVKLTEEEMKRFNLYKVKSNSSSREEAFLKMLENMEADLEDLDDD